jgi:hypothetical protein
MFKLELDLSLYYVPPMDEHGRGIVVTRVLELPFVPSPGILVWSKEMDGGDEPMGIKLDDLTWDIDRQVFLAKTCLIDCGPMVMVPHNIRDLIDRGWRFGSYLDSYPSEIKDRDVDEVPVDPVPYYNKDWDDDEMETWPTLRPTARPAEFNVVFGALIRTLAELYNNDAVAYAMDKTKIYFDEADLKENNSEVASRWRDKQEEFGRMPLEKRLAWRRRVRRKYPSLARIVASL